MKLTKSKLKKIIFQEAKKVLREGGFDSPWRIHPAGAEEHYPFSSDESEDEEEDWSGHGEEEEEEDASASDEYDEINYGSPEFGYDDHPDKRSKPFGSYSKNRDGDGY